MSMQNLLRRRRYIVNKKIQLTLIILVVLAMLLTLFAITAATYCIYFSSIVEQIGAAKAADLGIRAWCFVDPTVVVVQAIFLILLSILFGVFSIFFMHRIIGPLVRIKSAMKELKEKGYTQRIKIRKNDYLTEFVEAFNDMAAGIEEKYGRKNA